MKTCPVCKESKPLDAFWKDKRRPGGNRWQCKSCANEANKANRLRREAHPEGWREARRRSYAANREKNLEYARLRREGNPEKYREAGRHSREAHPEKAREASRRWKKTHPGEHCQASHNSDARKRGATGGNHTFAEWLALLESTGYRCTYCNWELTRIRPVPAGKRQATRDHVIPCAVGGSNEIWNIVPSCRPCNSTREQKRRKSLALSVQPLSPSASSVRSL